MPGASLDDAICGGELTVGGDVLRYHGHEFPVRPGTAHLPELPDAQFYRLVPALVAAGKILVGGERLPAGGVRTVPEGPGRELQFVMTATDCCELCDAGGNGHSNRAVEPGFTGS